MVIDPLSATVALIVFVAIFTQTVAGFGLGLVAMPLLIHVVGVRTATPLVAAIGLVAGAVMLARYRASLRWDLIWRLSLASLIGIPLGTYALGFIDERLITTTLGVVVIGYALYVLFGLTLPRLAHPAWAYGLGFVSGLLSGSTNTGGPPLIIYGQANRWDPLEFKGNLQVIFMIAGILAMVTHLMSGNFTPGVWRNVWISLPGLLPAFVLGFLLDKRINAELFRRVVLILLVIMGVLLIVR
ncbi:MAG: sulfite exporter TauE/SafE family protein [Anaerolineae bacterium]|nr:sulfite exporter TauE/SafE family protein [Anaerolineae bacterium]